MHAANACRSSHVDPPMYPVVSLQYVLPSTSTDSLSMVSHVFVHYGCDLLISKLPVSYGMLL